MIEAQLTEVDTRLRFIIPLLEYISLPRTIKQINDLYSKLRLESRLKSRLESQKYTLASNAREVISQIGVSDD